MLTYSEHIDLREKLASGEIGSKLAKEQLWTDFKEGERSWHTKDWKERRIQFIKDECEICSSKDTLTIQHLSHPKTYSEYLREVTRECTKDHREANSKVDKSEFSKYVLDKYEYLPIPWCPYCKNKNPSERVSKMPKYRCPNCKNEFDEAVHKSVDELISIFYEDEEAYEVRDKCFISRDKWRNKQNLSNIKYWMQREQEKSKDSERIEKEALLRYLNDCIKYLSFEDTITACRRCAYNYDLKQMELCPKCKHYYKGIQYPTCIQCLPEEKRKAAFESIAFGKEMREMHKRLGID